MYQVITQTLLVSLVIFLSTASLSIASPLVSKGKAVDFHVNGSLNTVNYRGDGLENFDWRFIPMAIYSEE